MLPAWVATVAERMPAELKRWRGLSMLEAKARIGGPGLGDITCPACKGKGTVVEDFLEPCPLCCGMATVPRLVAAYYQDQAGQKGVEDE